MKNFVHLKRVFALVLAVMFVGSAFASKNVVFVWAADGKPDPHPSQVIADRITTELGYTVTAINKAQLVSVPEEGDPVLDEEFLAQLEAADLIIIDRGIGSWNWNVESSDVWNTIETPVLNMNPFSVRYGYLAWFESTTVNYMEAGDVMALAMMPEDPVLDGITLSEDNTFHLWTGRYNVIALGAEEDLDWINGDVVLAEEFDGGYNGLLVRFAANEPFAVEGDDTPAGKRTFFGLGADNGTDDEGNQVFDYTNFTEDGWTVFLREVELLVAEDGPVSVGENKLATVSVSPNPATSQVTVQMEGLAKVEVIDLTGKVNKTVAANGNSVVVNLDDLNAGVIFVRATDASGAAVVQKVVKK